MKWHDFMLNCSCHIEIFMFGTWTLMSLDYVRNNTFGWKNFDSKVYSYITSHLNAEAWTMTGPEWWAHWMCTAVTPQRNLENELSYQSARLPKTLPHQSERSTKKQKKNNHGVWKNMTGLMYLKYVPISKPKTSISLLCFTTDISLQIRGSNHFSLAAMAVAGIWA